MKTDLTLVWISSKNWISEPRKHHCNLPKKLVSVDFKDEYTDLIFMLNKIMGTPLRASFETWMYYFVEEITKGNVMMNWARMISDNLDA